jgi:hypothetical protein
MLWKSAFWLASVALMAGCGDAKTSATAARTVTVTRTEIVTVEVEPSAPAEASTAQERADFCASEDGDALQQAESEHTDAYNDADAGAAVRYERKARKAAENAPAGADCAVQALDSIRFNYNNGSSNFGAIDYKARAKSIRKFQRQHDLQKVLPNF